MARDRVPHWINLSIYRRSSKVGGGGGELYFQKKKRALAMCQLSIFTLAIRKAFLSYPPIRRSKQQGHSHV